MNCLCVSQVICGFQAQFLFMNVRLVLSEIYDCAIHSRKFQSYIITNTLIPTLWGHLRGFFSTLAKSNQNQKQVSLFISSARYGLFIDHKYKSSCVCLNFSAYFNIYYAEQDNKIVMHNTSNQCCKDGTWSPIRNKLTWGYRHSSAV